MINDSIEYKDTVQNAYHLCFPFYPDHEQPLDPRRDCLLPRMMVPCIRLLANCEKMGGGVRQGQYIDRNNKER